MSRHYGGVVAATQAKVVCLLVRRGELAEVVEW